MSSLQELRDMAESFGLKGTEAGKFVEHQQALQREERAKGREEREKEREKERIFELAQREEREKERVFELAKLKLEKEKPTPVLQDSSVRGPKLPAYHEDEDIASYLTRFERIAQLLGVKDDTLAVRLGSLLTGKAAKLYSTLDINTISDFSLLKQALLIGFDKTPERYRLDFRNSRIQVGENYRQFSTRLQQLFDSWLEASQVDQTVEKLREFMILDQFLASLSPDLRLFLKEQNITVLKTMVEKADIWASAHHAYPRQNTSGTHTKSSTYRKPAGAGPSDKGENSTNPKTIFSKVKCYNCGEEGHISSRCPKNPRAFKTSLGTQPKNNVGFCMSDRTPFDFTVAGTINGSWTSTIIRDTGCNCVIVSEEAIPDADVSSAPKVLVEDFLGRVDEFPVIRCFIRCPYYEGWIDAIRAPMKRSTLHNKDSE